jgi:hypothetical protein
MPLVDFETCKECGGALQRIFPENTSPLIIVVPK